MRLKSCKRCGKAFETDRQGVYLCSDCAAAAKRASVYRERICTDCGTAFWGYPKSKRCPDCQAEIDRIRDRAQKHRGPARPLGSTDVCARCGREYVVMSGLQRYCKDCAPNAVRDNINVHKRQYMADNAQQDAARKAANRSSNKICVICGKVFDADTATVTCSPECAAIRRQQWQRTGDAKRAPRQRSPKKEDK